DYEEPPIERRFLVDLEDARLRVERLLPLLDRDTSILEIGSGSGAFLDCVHPHAGAVVGIEPENEARAWISWRGTAPVVPGVDDVAGRSFDIVVLFHVLEHVREPVPFLERLGRLLAPAGRLVVEVPNVDDALVALYRTGAYLAFYFQKAH